MSQPKRIEINKTLGTQVRVSVPATVAALIAIYGEAVVYNAALKHSFYQPWNTAFRKSVEDQLPTILGIPREQITDSSGNPVFKTNRAKEKVEVLEDLKDYLARVKEMKDDAGNAVLDDARYDTILQDIADTVPFVMAELGDEKEPDKAFFQAARQVLLAISEGRATEESFSTKWEAQNAGKSIADFGEFGELSIARALEWNADRIKRESVAGLI